MVGTSKARVTVPPHRISFTFSQSAGRRDFIIRPFYSMSLATGTRGGAYEVLGRLGAGNIGDLYRAHDTKPIGHVRNALAHAARKA